MPSPSLFFTGHNPVLTNHHPMRLHQLIFFAPLLLTISIHAQIADSSMRKVGLQGAINCRDLGGYRTTDGRHVKWHVLYRCADISKLTPADLDTLQARHIRYDVDLRGVAESAKAPDRILPGTDYILCPAGSDSTNSALFQRVAQMTSGGDSLMIAFYSNLTYLPARYQPFFAKMLVLPDTDALVFHCTAGKDRTGIAAALLLYALGVPYETIQADYVATNYYRAPANDQAIRGMKTSSSGMNDQVAHALMTADAAYIKATFDAIRRQYGSVDRFLAEQIGLDQQKREQLKQKYLEY